MEGGAVDMRDLVVCVVALREEVAHLRRVVQRLSAQEGAEAQWTPPEGTAGVLRQAVQRLPPLLELQAWRESAEEAAAGGGDVEEAASWPKARSSSVGDLEALSQASVGLLSVPTRPSNSYHTFEEGPAGVVHNRHRHLTAAFVRPYQRRRDHMRPPSPNPGTVAVTLARPNSASLTPSRSATEQLRHNNHSSSSGGGGGGAMISHSNSNSNSNSNSKTTTLLHQAPSEQRALDMLERLGVLDSPAPVALAQSSDPFLTQAIPRDVNDFHMSCLEDVRGVDGKNLLVLSRNAVRDEWRQSLCRGILKGQADVFSRRLEELTKVRSGRDILPSQQESLMRCVLEALSAACYIGDEESFRSLLKLGAVPMDDSTMPEIQLLLYRCVNQGFEFGVKKLLRRGAFLHEFLVPSPLCRAVELGYSQILRLMLSYNADPNTIPAPKDSSGSMWSPLAFAIRVQNADLVQEMLNMGFNPNVPGTGIDLKSHPDLKSPYHLAPPLLVSVLPGGGHTEIVQALLSKGAKISSHWDQEPGHPVIIEEARRYSSFSFSPHLHLSHL